jgi:hypothetical protein
MRLEKGREDRSPRPSSFHSFVIARNRRSRGNPGRCSAALDWLAFGQLRFRRFAPRNDEVSGRLAMTNESV